MTASESQRAWNTRGGTWRVHNHGKSKLSPRQRDEIVARLRDGGDGNSVRELALEFGVSTSTVRNTARR